MKNLHFILTAVSAIILIGSITAAAQDTAGHNAKSNDLFRKCSRAGAIYLEHFNSADEDRDISILQLNAEAGYYILRGLSLNGNAYLFMANGKRILEDAQPPVELNSDVQGAGLNGFIRWDVIRISSHSLYLEAGAGMVFTTKNFPPGGTPWNLTRRHGFGMSFRLTQHTRILMGWRSMHISNGKGFGHPQNPAYDGSGLYLGFRF